MNPAVIKKDRRKQNLIPRQDFRMEEPIVMLDYAGTTADDCLSNDYSPARTSKNRTDVQTKLIGNTSDSSTGIQFTYKKVERLSSSARPLRPSDSALNSEKCATRVDSNTDTSLSDKFTMCHPDFFKSVDPNSILPNTYIRSNESASSTSQSASNEPDILRTDSLPPKSKSIKVEAMKVKKNLSQFYSDPMHHCEVCKATFDDRAAWCKHLIIIHPGYAKQLSLEMPGKYSCEKCVRSFKTKNGLDYHLGLSVC